MPFYIYTNYLVNVVLAALSRSGKRVRAVIQIELPFLVSQELVSKQENDCCAVRNSENGHFNEGTADLHRARCDTIFDQMDNALSEEEKHLVSQVALFMLYICELPKRHIDEIWTKNVRFTMNNNWFI